MTELGRMLREDAIEESKLEIAKTLLKNRALTKEEIAKNVGLSPEKVDAIEKELMALQ